MLNRVTTAIFVLELLMMAVWFRYVSWTPSKAVGGLLMVGSMVLLIAARRQLGTAFSVRARASRLVTRGVYARLRNPIYAAGVGLFLGAGLVLARWWPVVIAALLVPLQSARARREARVLEARFGEQYRQYRRHTWF